MTSVELQTYLEKSPDIPNAAALAKEGYLDEFTFPHLWDPVTEDLYVKLDDGIFRVVSMETVRTTNWHLEPFAAEQARGLLDRYHEYFRKLEQFFNFEG